MPDVSNCGRVVDIDVSDVDIDVCCVYVRGFVDIDVSDVSGFVYIDVNDVDVDIDVVMWMCVGLR